MTATSAGLGLGAGGADRSGDRGGLGGVSAAGLLDAGLLPSIPSPRLEADVEIALRELVEVSASGTAFSSSGFFLVRAFLAAGLAFALSALTGIGELALLMGLLAGEAWNSRPGVVLRVRPPRGERGARA